jgi:hypothetical protein
MPQFRYTVYVHRNDFWILHYKLFLVTVISGDLRLIFVIHYNCESVWKQFKPIVEPESAKPEQKERKKLLAESKLKWTYTEYTWTDNLFQTAQSPRC